MDVSSNAPRALVTAAVLVSLVLLPGTMVAGVMASSGVASHSGPGYPQVDTEPTPSPTPEATPTPSPTPTPTPESTPTPTPTPTPETTPTPTPTPGPFGAEIVVRKVIDSDADENTTDDQSPSEGWEFELALADGAIDEASPITNSDGLAGWLISFGPGGTSVTLTEVPQEDFDLLTATCLKIPDSGGPAESVFADFVDEDSIAFQIEEGEFATYQCDFVNIPTDTSLVAIFALKLIDSDASLNTLDDVVFHPSWQFQAVFEDDVQILSVDPLTGDDQSASWLIRHPGDSTRVVVTEVPQDGYRRLAASCYEGGRDFPVPTSLDGHSISFDVSGFVFGPNSFSCDFRNTRVGVGALPTLPPTDASRGSTIPGSDALRLMLAGLAALIAGLLVLRSHPPASRRR